MKNIRILFLFFMLFLGTTYATLEDMRSFQKITTFSREYDFSNVKEQYEFVDFITHLKLKNNVDENIPELKFLITDAWKKIEILKPSILEKIEKTYKTLIQKSEISLLNIHEFYAEIAFAYDDLLIPGVEVIKNLKIFF